MTTETTLQKQQFKTFLDALMVDVPANYFWVQPGEGGTHKSLWFVPSSGKLPKVPANHHVWFGVNGNAQMRGEYERALKEQIRVSNCFFADFDVRVGEGEDVSAAKAAQLVLIETLPQPPSVIIDSVGGFHCYWLFTKPQHFAPSPAHTLFCNAQYGWVYRLGADTDATDISRTLRVAGTENLKPEYAGKNRLVRFMKHDLELRYDASLLMSLGLETWDALQKEKAQARPPRKDTPQPDGTVNLEHARRYAQEALKSIFIELSGMQSGSHRTVAVHERACRLGGMVGAGILDYQEAWTTLWDAAVNNGIVAKEGRSSIETQIRNGLDYGMRDPHDLSKFVKEVDEYPRPESEPENVTPRQTPKTDTYAHDNKEGDTLPPDDIPPDDSESPAYESVPVLYRDLESELAIIKLALTDSGSAIVALGRLPEASIFYKVGHQLVWTAMLKLFRKADIEESPVVRRLKVDGKYAAVGGDAFFNELASVQAKPDSLEHYLDSVETCATRRFLLTLPDLFKVLASDPTKNAEGLLQAAQALLAPAVKRTVRHPDYTYMELVNKIFDETFENSQLPEEDKKKGLIKTGFSALDYKMGGFKASDLVVIGARPSMGKSLFMLIIALWLARRGIGVGFITIEMRADSMGERGVASEGGIPSQEVRERNLTTDDYFRKMASVYAGSDIPLVFNDNPSPDVYWIDAWIAKHAASGKSVFFIDFLQIMPARPGVKFTDRKAVVGDNVTYLKSIARKHNVTIILASQVKREVDNRRDKRPILSDFADSTEIETVADIALFLYRDAYYFPSTKMPNVLSVLIRKNRNFGVGEAELYYDLPKQVIRDIDHTERIDLSHFNS